MTTTRTTTTARINLKKKKKSTIPQFLLSSGLGNVHKGCPIFCHFLRYLPTLVLFCPIFSYISKIGHPLWTFPYRNYNNEFTICFLVTRWAIYTLKPINQEKYSKNRNKFSKNMEICYRNIWGNHRSRKTLASNNFY